LNESILHIINACKKHDRLAQQALFNAFAPRLLSVSRQYTPQSLDAMDNLHDSFIKIFKYIESFDVEKGNFDAWAKRIVINTALDKLNKRKLEEMVNNYEDYDIPDIDDFYEKYGIDHIKCMIDQLPDIYRQVFCLYEIEGFSHKEIADQLSIKESTSRSQLNRSKELLRSIFIKYDEIYYLKVQRN
jgi:RNA polymerase sigma factor (sigma-70 family)